MDFQDLDTPNTDGIIGNRSYQDSVFRDLFKEPKRAVELINALCDTHYSEHDILDVTLKQVMSRGMYNDLAFLTKDNKLIVLIEHQASLNPNMPFRLLLYVAKEYEKFITGGFDGTRYNLYNERLIPLPKPEFFVLYTGSKEMPATQILKLSDSFFSKAPLELKVMCYNLNKELDIKTKSDTLNNYSHLIALIKQALKQGHELKDAIKLAVEFCISNQILNDYLLKNRSEVSSMLAFEYSLEDEMKVLKQESREEGLKEGIKEGIKEGLKKGQIEGAQKAKTTIKQMIRLKNSGYSFEQIAKECNVPLEEVLDIFEE